MSDIRISQLDSVTGLGTSDLLAISKSLGGGRYESKSITALNATKAFSSAKVIYVSKDGASDASTIKDGVAIALALAPSSSNPIHVHVYPGYYSENNPIAIPPYVTLCTEGDFYGAIVVAENDGDIFTASGSSVLSGFTINGQASFTNVAYKSTTSTSSNISNCIVRNCKIGCWSNGGSIDAFMVVGLSKASPTETFLDKFVCVTNGGFINASSCGVISILASPTYGFYCEGSGSDMYMFSCNITGATNGIYANNLGYVDCFSGHMDDCVNGINIGPIGASGVRCVSTVIEDSISKDIIIDSSTAHLSYVGAFDSSKFSIVSGATVSSQANDANTGGGLSIGQTTSWNTMNVGTPGAIQLGRDINVNIGEGPSFVNDQYGNPIVEFWSYNATAPSGSQFTRFVNNAGVQLAGANDAIIVGCKYAFPAIRLDVDVAMVTSSYLMTEYWNGTSWIDLAPTNSFGGGGVAGYRRSDYYNRGNAIFRNVETQFVEVSQAIFDDGNWADDYDVLDQIPKWDANEPFYALRFVNNAALTSGMTFKNGKVKPNSTVFSSSGKRVNFGEYRSDRSLYIDSESFNPDSVNPPTYTSIQVSPSIGYGNVPLFPKANDTSQVSIAFTIPYEIDTASPLRCYIDGTTVSSATGNIASTLYVSRINSRNPAVAFPLPEIEIGQQTTAAPGIANGFVTIYQDIDISAYYPDDLLFIAFARKAGSNTEDTYNGDLIVRDITFRYHAKFV